MPKRDTDILAQRIVEKLTRLRHTVATAESCTGGLLASRITDISGALEVFHYGWVTYANEAKVSQLGVAPHLLERYGAVSVSVARAMAAGARRIAGSDYALALTGIAGPNGGTLHKPVGTVFIALATPKTIQTKKCFFPLERREFKARATDTALKMLAQELGFRRLKALPKASPGQRPG